MRFCIFKRYHFDMTTNNLYAPSIPHKLHWSRRILYVLSHNPSSLLSNSCDTSSYSWDTSLDVRLLYLSSMFCDFFSLPHALSFLSEQGSVGCTCTGTECLVLGNQFPEKCKSYPNFGWKLFPISFSPWKFLIRRPSRNNPAADLSWGLGLHL